MGSRRDESEGIGAVGSGGEGEGVKGGQGCGGDGCGWAEGRPRVEGEWLSRRDLGLWWFLRRWKAERRLKD